MKDFDENNLVLIKDFSNFGSCNHSLSLINLSNREISLNKIYDGEEILLHKVADFSFKNQNVCVLFSKVSLFELPVKMGAFVLNNGSLLGLVEEGKIIANNLIDVFETNVGRLGILIYEDVYEHNIFYYLETLDVDLVIVFCGEEDVDFISQHCTNLPCVFVVGNKIFFNKM